MIQKIWTENVIKKYIRNHRFFLFGETVLVFFQNFSSQGITGLLFCVPPSFFPPSSLCLLPQVLAYLPFSPFLKISLFLVPPFFYPLSPVHH